MSENDTIAETKLLQTWNGLGAKSNRVYVIDVREVPGGWQSFFAHGGKNKAMKSGTKMNGPGTYAEALASYKSMQRERVGSGYAPADDIGRTSVVAASGKKHSGVDCQVSNPVGEADAQALIEDPAYCAQLKYDGDRLLVRKDASDLVEAINRKGNLTGISEDVRDTAGGIAGAFILDGEAMGQRMMAFDILEAEGRDLRSLPLRERLDWLRETIPDEGAISVAPTAFTAAAKRAMYEAAKANLDEGILFKRIASPYVAGSPNKGGDHLKRKFLESLSAVVRKVNQQRSVELELLDASTGKWVSIGNCSITTAHQIPDVADVVEVAYRKAHRTGGLAEPVYKGLRRDVDPEQCTTAQLVYKDGVPGSDIEAPRPYIKP